MSTSRLIIFASTLTLTSLTRILLIKKKLIHKNLYHILLTDERDERWATEGDRAIAQGHSNMRHWTVLDVISRATCREMRFGRSRYRSETEFSIAHYRDAVDADAFDAPRRNSRN